MSGGAEGVDGEERRRARADDDDGEGRRRRRGAAKIRQPGGMLDVLLARMKIGAGRGTARRFYAVRIFSPGWRIQPRLKIDL